MVSPGWRRPTPWTGFRPAEARARAESRSLPEEEGDEVLPVPQVLPRPAEDPQVLARRRDLREVPAVFPHERDDPLHALQPPVVKDDHPAGAATSRGQREVDDDVFEPVVPDDEREVVPPPRPLEVRRMPLGVRVRSRREQMPGVRGASSESRPVFWTDDCASPVLRRRVSEV